MQIEKKLLDLLKRDNTWEFMTNFVRAVFPMLIVLRLADQKEPVMDKLFYYIRRMDVTLEKSAAILDELQSRMKGTSWRILSDINLNDVPNPETEVFEEYTEEDESTDSDSVDQDTTAGLGKKVKDLWFKRRDKMVTDFAIAGWLLSPIPEVYNDSSAHMTGDHRDAVDRLLNKMMGSDFADDSDELAEIMNTFWEEFESFKTKSGHFQKAYIWSSANRDLMLGKSHYWHKKNSYFQTKILGKFACRVCSKIVGMGSAERNWGDVKYLKSEKRSHLSAEAVEKQATIFGASCMQDARIMREKVQSSTNDKYKFWDEEDFDNEFDMLRTVSSDQQKRRSIKCYLESWENDHLRKKNDVSKAKFLHKYGGLEFKDLDSQALLTISDTELTFRRRSKGDRGGWAVVAYSATKEKTIWPIEYGCPLHDCIATFYETHPEKNVNVLVRKEQVEEIKWLIKQDSKRSGNADGESESSSTESTDSKSELDKKPAARKTAKQTMDSRATGDGLRPCGGCGNQVGPVHKCDVCFRNMHPFCGRTIGEEGYGSTVRCPDCDKKSK